MSIQKSPYEYFSVYNSKCHKSQWGGSSHQRGEQLLSQKHLKNKQTKKNPSKLLNISPSINIYILLNMLDTSLYKEKKKKCKL